MRSNKHYTKQTFSGRVDCMAGRRQSSLITRAPAVCADSGNVYSDGCWSKHEPTRDGAKQPPFRAGQTTLCPDCKAIRRMQPGGCVHLSGEFVRAHREEIEELLSNEPVRVEEHNPVACIMGWDESHADELTVTTTTTRLARRLGHVLEQAFHGSVRYDFSHENEFAQVWWQRD